MLATIGKAQQGSKDHRLMIENNLLEIEVVPQDSSD